MQPDASGCDGLLINTFGAAIGKGKKELMTRINTRIHNELNYALPYE